MKNCRIKINIFVGTLVFLIIKFYFGRRQKIKSLPPEHIFQENRCLMHSSKILLKYSLP